MQTPLQERYGEPVDHELADHSAQERGALVQPKPRFSD
jgi:hypothetical protein